MRKPVLALLLALSLAPSLVVAVPAAAEDAAPTFVFAPPAWLRVESPPGLSIPFSGDTGDFYRDGEDGSRWTAKLSVWKLHSDPGTTAAVVAASATTDTLADHPGATARVLSNLPENGFPTVLATVTYPDAFSGNLPQVEYVKTIEGGGYVHVLRYSFRGQPSTTDAEAVLAYLKSVHMCRTKDAC